MSEVTAIIAAALPELTYTTARSGGSGGQHVNKVETKVTLRWSIKQSAALDDKQRAVLLEKLSNAVNQDGELVLHDQSSRSQLKNKDLVTKKWKRLVQQAFRVRKARKPTRPSEQAVADRLKAKGTRSVIKSLRKKPSTDHPL